ncbi:MAG: UDP-N-acetylmuramoylalanyl-D-glutamate--2,6-diaminopimelate ligase, partial [Frankiales bacterium]|nr:UDP-N-acetylmuramoylalanyl-D-glutamate--2,6-diaminopimelate ligase [Frankiales bacterium]
GAVAVLTDRAGADLLRELPSRWEATPTLVIAEPRAALGELAAAVYGHPSQRLGVYGVTGTAGKTTTTFLVRAGLAAAGELSGLIGTVGVFVGERAFATKFTTPEAPELQALLAIMAEQGCRHVGMEVSSHALRLGRVDGVQFEVAGFTNLSQDHLDFHADMEDYFAAKALLFDGRARREVVVCDDEWGSRLVTAATVTVARTRPADWTALDVEVAADGATRFTVRGPGQEFAAGCRIPGDYNVTNALLAFAILDELGHDPAALAPALAQAQVRGRMERVDAGQPFLAIVDYSHKPAGVEAALRALRPLTPGRLVIVLGCGGDRDRGKRPVMGEVAARGADVLIVTDDNPRSEDPAAIRAAMLAGAGSVPAELAAETHEEGDRRSAIALAIGLAEPGDTVLIAGKGHESGQQVGNDMLPFDDVSVVREALSSKGFHASGPDGLNLGGSVSGR